MFLVSLSFLTASYVNAGTFGDWVYSVENGEATITGYIGSGGELTIPSEVDGIPVKRIGGGSLFTGEHISPIFDEEVSNINASVTSIIIPSGVVEISDGAFQSLWNLTNVVIPSGVTSIGYLAFSGAYSLKSLKIPETVVSFGGNSLAYCYSLLDLEAPQAFWSRRSDELANAASAGNAVNMTALVDALSKKLATNNAFIANLAQAIIATSNNYGLATQTNTQIAIATATSNFVSQSQIINLASKTELTNALAESRANGINSVISNPNLWTLYTTNQIHAMAVGDLVLTSNNNGQFVLNYDIEQSEDLVNWTPYQGFAMPLTNLPTNKAFVRIKAKQ